MVKILHTGDEGEWSDYLEMIDPGRRDIYFTPRYYKIYENSGAGTACCFVYTDEGSAGLYPFLRNSINALGYDLDKEYQDIQGAYGYNGIITSADDPAFMAKMLHELAGYCASENIVAEFTRFHPLLKNYRYCDKYFNVVFDRPTVYLDLQENPGVIFERFQYSTKRQIKRAVNRFGLTTDITTSGSLFTEEVYGLYRKTMERVDAPADLYFSEEFFREMLSLKESVLFRALLEGTTVAFIAGFGNGGYFQGYLAGSLKETIHMSPNSLLYWEMIKYAKENGCRYLHLGGGDTPDADNSLLKFKMNFSKETAEFRIGKKTHDVRVYDEVIRQWRNKPGSGAGRVNENILLKYRYLD